MSETRVDAIDILEQIRRRVSQDALSAKRDVAARVYTGAIRLGTSVSAPTTLAVGASSIRPTDSTESAARLEALKESLLSGFERSLLAIGEPPPAPPNLRGRVGRVIIQLLRRSLWWYSRSLITFGDAVSRHFHDEAALLTEMLRIQEEQHAEIAALRKEVERLRGTSTDTA